MYIKEQDLEAIQFAINFIADLTRDAENTEYYHKEIDVLYEIKIKFIKQIERQNMSKEVNKKVKKILNEAKSRSDSGGK